MENRWLFALILVLLFIFGYIYNFLVGWLERNGYESGYTAILVVGGTAMTLLGAVPLIGLENTLVVLACFAASGFWMVVGSWQRHREAEKHDQDDALQLAQEALRDEEDRGRVRLATRDC